MDSEYPMDYPGVPRRAPPPRLRVIAGEGLLSRCLHDGCKAELFTCRINQYGYRMAFCAEHWNWIDLDLDPIDFPRAKTGKNPTGGDLSPPVSESPG